MFKVKDRQNSCVEPFEFLPAKSGEVYALGEALTYTDEVTKCAETAKPTHICMGPGDGNVVPVMPVLATTRFEAPYDAKPTAGTAVTLGTTAESVTATTASGVFTVTDVDEAAGVCCGFFK